MRYSPFPSFSLLRLLVWIVSLRRMMSWRSLSVTDNCTATFKDTPLNRSLIYLDDVYVQNHKSLKNYFRAIDSGELPIKRGVILDSDDIICRTVIMELMCQFQVSLDEIQEKYHLSFDCDFAKYFSQE